MSLLYKEGYSVQDLKNAEFEPAELQYICSQAKWVKDKTTQILIGFTCPNLEKNRECKETNAMCSYPF